MVLCEILYLFVAPHAYLHKFRGQNNLANLIFCPTAAANSCWH